MQRALEDLVWERAVACCEYCRIPQHFDVLDFEVDHVIARVHGGLTVPANLALSCFTCNRHKGPNLSGIDPLTGEHCRRFNPRRHKWERHFQWRGPVLWGRTAVGRTTIRVLQSNDHLRVLLRRELLEEGELLTGAN